MLLRTVLSIAAAPLGAAVLAASAATATPATPTRPHRPLVTAQECIHQGGHPEYSPPPPSCIGGKLGGQPLD